jgi:uncharacterized glyoxalase superfamily protein PhnB
MPSDKMVNPPVKGGIAPYISVDGASAASEFYQRAFAAAEVARMPGAADGRLLHCHLYINGASVMLSDPFPEHGHPAVKPAGFTININIAPDDDIAMWFGRAVDAGCTVVMPLEKMFWGDKYCQLRDPFGVLWSMNQAAEG